MKWKRILLIIIGLAVLILLIFAYQRNPSFERSLDISPINKVAYEKGGQIWVADSDFKNPQRITKGKRYWEDPVWCSDGTKLAFTGVTDQNVGIPELFGDVDQDLFYYDFTADRLERLTTTSEQPKSVRSNLTWAPDCQRYAYINMTGELTIGSIETKTSNTVFESDNYGDHISWSRGGERILFTELSRNNDFDVTILDAEGRYQTKIGGMDVGIPAGIYISGVAWGFAEDQLILNAFTDQKILAPNGQKMFQDRLYSTSITNPKNLKELRALSLHYYLTQNPYPILSLDTDLIAILNNAVGDIRGRGIVTVIKSDGTLIQEDITKEIPLSHREELLGVVDGYSWHPSGDKLAITLGRGDGLELWVVSTDGQEVKLIPGIKHQPTWSPKVN